MEKTMFFLAMVVILAISPPVNAQSTLPLQEKCAEGAKKFYNEWQQKNRPIFLGNPFLPLPLGYTSHYSKKLDKCFISINGLGQTKAEYYDGTLVKRSHTVFSQHVYDAYGGGLYAHYYDDGEIKDCRIKDKEMSCTFEEFRKLIKQFMED